MSDTTPHQQLIELAEYAANLERDLRESAARQQQLASDVAHLAGALAELETAQAIREHAQLFDIDLACGDTIASARPPAIGARRRCIHCDSSRKVVRVRLGDTVIAVDPQLAIDEQSIADLRRAIADGQI